MMGWHYNRGGSNSRVGWHVWLYVAFSDWWWKR